MIHTLVENVPGSPGTATAGSAGAAPFSPYRHNAGRTDTLVGTALGVVVRTTTSTRPGITPGGRTSTRNPYGPAVPSCTVSELPTCALDVAHIAASRATREITRHHVCPGT